MINERQQFLAKIIENPNDDVVRLVFADWLEENGNPCYSHMIREQIGHHPISEWVWGKHPQWQIDEETGIEIEKQFPYMVELYHPQLGTYTVKWDRGFIKTIECNTSFWFTHDSQICQEHPIQQLILTDKEPYPFQSGRFAWFDKSVPFGRQYFNLNQEEQELDLQLFNRSQIQENIMLLLKGTYWDNLKCKTYNTKEQANSNLSDVLISIARSKIDTVTQL